VSVSLSISSALASARQSARLMPNKERSYSMPTFGSVQCKERELGELLKQVARQNNTLSTA
jgi:hypothetical protein